MTATATIAATERRGVLTVPNTALRFTPTTGTAAPAATESAGLLSKLMPRPPGRQHPAQRWHEDRRGRPAPDLDLKDGRPSRSPSPPA